MTRTIPRIMIGFMIKKACMRRAKLPLIERKRQLKKLLARKRPRILYLDHVENDGRLLFEQIVKMDLEGMVCKRKSSPYRATEKPSPYWVKVKNRRYSQ